MLVLLLLPLLFVLLFWGSPSLSRRCSWLRLSPCSWSRCSAVFTSDAEVATPRQLAEPRPAPEAQMRHDLLR